MEKALKFDHGKWEQMTNILYRDIRPNFGGDEEMEPDPQARGYGPPAELFNRNGVKVEVYARLTDGGYPYIVFVTISGKRETIFVLDFHSLLEVLSRISAALATGQ